MFSLRLIMKSTVTAGALWPALAAMPARAVDWVTAEITCPASVKVKLDWQNTIGSNPPFYVNNTSTHNLAPKLSGMYRLSDPRWKKVIWCEYKHGDAVVGKYSYHVQREIHPTEGCKKVSPGTMRCLVRAK